MRVLFFGSRNLGWKHMPVAKALAMHATLGTYPTDCNPTPPMGLELMSWLMAQAEPDEKWPKVDGTLTLIHGDDPPGKTPGAVGAPKLAEFACMETWREPRRVRRCRIAPAASPGDEHWAVDSQHENLVGLRLDRAYCIHTDLDASRSSTPLVRSLLAAGIGFTYARVTPGGVLLSVEFRHPSS